MKIGSQLSQANKLKGIFHKQYQNRTSTEHALMVRLIEPYFSSLSSVTVKLITFYMRFIQQSTLSQRQDDKKHESGILIKLVHNQDKQGNDRNLQASHEYQMLKGQKIHFQNDQTYGLYVSYDDYLSCLALGQTSIQQQINFFSSSQYLCSMPKKKYFNILRNSKVLSYTYRQSIYCEGQMISPGESGSGVHIVRLGQFSYVKTIDGKNVQVLRFGSGHLLGTLDLQAKQNKRVFGVKTKTSRANVYHMSQQYFNLHVRPYCENILQKNQRKLSKFLVEQSTEIYQTRASHPQFSTIKKSMSLTNQLNGREKKTQSVHMFTSRDLPTLIKTSRQSLQIEAEQLRKTSFMELKYDGPLKHYPMVSQRSKFTSSEFKDLEKLMQKNDKITKIRNIKKQQLLGTKQQILFRLFQNSWKFDKLKKNRNTNLIY